MKALTLPTLLNSNRIILNLYKPTSLYISQINRFLTSLQYNNNNKVTNDKPLPFQPKTSILFFNKSFNFEIQTFNKLDKNFIIKHYSTQLNSKNSSNEKEAEVQEGKSKKSSKFKQFYTQYGPMFLVVHLTTVVMWIYGFYLISKQGYDITKLLDLFHKINLMTEETVKTMHHKIDNYKMESGWITGQNIKHFATAYMVYKVIAPFRYMVSIGIVRFLVKNLRAKGLMKSN